MKERRMKSFEFKEGVHFSRAGLAERLNEIYGEKQSGVKFTARDVQQYSIRGVLPKAYGGHEIKEFKIPKLGVFVECEIDKK